MLGRFMHYVLFLVFVYVPFVYGCEHGGDEEPQGQSLNTRKRSKPIIGAIYRFKADCGLWPSSLDELVPEYASSEEIRGWSYKWKPSNWWYLTDYGNFPNSIARYEVRDNNSGWLLTNGEEETWIKGTAYVAPETTKSKEEVHRNCLRVFQTRINQTNCSIVHSQGLICWHFQRKEYEQAYTACLACREHWPKHWWPPLMLAQIEYKLDRSKEADKRLFQLLSEHNDLPHLYLVCQTYLDVGELEKAKQTITRASRGDLADVSLKSDDGVWLPLTADAFGWNAAVLCYKRGWIEQALAVCNRCDDLRRKRGYAEESYMAIQAACYLALRQEEKAQESLRRIMVESEKRGVWANNLPSLQEAVNKRNFTYSYDPGDFANPFSILIDYK